MKKINFIAFICFLFFIYECNDNKQIKKEKNTKAKVLVVKKELLKSKDSLTPKQLLILYTKSQATDTVVPYEVYISSKNKVFEGDIHYAYETYDEKKPRFESKLREMFSFDKNLESIFPQIEKYIQKTRELNREIVLKDYEEYSSLEGPYFSYLCNVKDSFVLEITEKIFNNRKADSTELKRISRWVLRNFNDSTYVKITENW